MWNYNFILKLLLSSNSKWVASLVMTQYRGRSIHIDLYMDVVIRSRYESIE